MHRLIRTCLVAALGLSFASVTACAEQPAPKKKKKKDEKAAKGGDQSDKSDKSDKAGEG